MLKKLFAFIFSVLLIPLTVAVTMAFYEGLLSLRISESGIIFILGAFGYSILHLIFFKLDFMYVLGHEFMHAVATFFSGGKVTKIKVSNRGGVVKTTSSNMFVMLAPYLVPFYTVLIAVLYVVLSFFLDIVHYRKGFIFLLGFTMMFHLSYTARCMKEKQSDLIKTGYLFSILFIYIINITVVFLILSFLFAGADFREYINDILYRSRHFYYYFWRELFF